MSQSMSLYQAVSLPMPSSKKPLISAQELCYQVDNKKLLDNVSFELYAGDKVVLLGRSGSGKSLLLKALADLLPLADGGAVSVRGVPMRKIAPTDYRSWVSLIHQAPMLIDDTVAANLALPMSFAHHCGCTFDRQWHIERLAQLGKHSDFMDKQAKDLSGGERQIVSFLRTLQLDPRILLIDEATSALDSDSATALIDLVLEWHDDQHDHDKALIWVTHTVEQSTMLDATVWQMDQGRLTTTI